MLEWALFIWGPIVLLVVVSFASVSLFHPSSPSSPVKHVASSRTPQELPRIPRTADEAHETMSDKTFELFSAAVILAQGEAHTFVECVGGGSDRGVDAVLRNIYQKKVIVQSKRYMQGNSVEPSQVRDFVGTIHLQNAVYGYIVTTSTLSAQAHEEAHSARGLIRVIERNQLTILLQRRPHEIALAYRDVLEAASQ